jgi:hypothetical protein
MDVLLSMQGLNVTVTMNDIVPVNYLIILNSTLIYKFMQAVFLIGKKTIGVMQLPLFLSLFYILDNTVKRNTN